MTPRPAHTVTPPILQILMSLAGADRHGYALMQEIEERTGGEVRLTASTLYGAIKRMLDAGWIREIEDASADPRRRTYRITDVGRGALQQEAARVEQLARQMRGLDLFGVEGR